MREEILSSAAELFIENGYYGLSMRQIAESVGVTKAALYYYFEDKESLFLAILETYLSKIESLIIEIDQEKITCPEKISLFVRSILSQPVNQRAIIRLASQELAHLSAASRKSFGDLYHDRFIKRIQFMLDAGIHSGELRIVDSEVATWTLLGMMYPYFYPVHTGEFTITDEVIGQIVDIYLGGVSVRSI